MEPLLSFLVTINRFLISQADADFLGEVSRRNYLPGILICGSSVQLFEGLVPRRMHIFDLSNCHRISARIHDLDRLFGVCSRILGDQGSKALGTRCMLLWHAERVRATDFGVFAGLCKSCLLLFTICNSGLESTLLFFLAAHAHVLSSSIFILQVLVDCHQVFYSDSQGCPSESRLWLAEILN